jgi:hypothetical protein
MKVVEVVLALLLTSVICGSAWDLALRQGRIVAALEVESRHLAALEEASLVLDWELAPGGPRHLERGDLRVRAWRGWGRVCEAGVDGAVLAWEGLRQPDARRDSILVVTSDGGTAILPLERTGSGGRRARSTCPGILVLTVRWPRGALGPGRVPVWIRAFEAGVYRADDALRYRRGRGGAQPLTETLMDPAMTGWRPTAGGTGLRLATPRVATERVW